MDKLESQSISNQMKLNTILEPIIEIQERMGARVYPDSPGLAGPARIRPLFPLFLGGLGSLMIAPANQKGHPLLRPRLLLGLALQGT